MMFIVSVILIFFIQYFITYNIAFIKKQSLALGIIFSIILFYSIFLGVTDTTDWKGYEYIFQNKEMPIDFLFRYLSYKGDEFNFGFKLIYQLHIILIGVMLIHFISKFNSNIFFIVSFILLILFVPLANQIRYFLALALYLNAIYYYCVKEKYFLFFFIATLSILSHIAIIPLYLFVPLFMIKSYKIFIRYSIIISLITFLSVVSLFKTGLLPIAFFDHFNAYIDSDHKSSILGGLFYLVPIILIGFLLKSELNKLTKLKILEFDKDFKFLVRLTIFSYIFIPGAIFMQILASRYSMALFFVWIILFLKISSYYNLKGRIKKFTIIFIVQWFYICYIYFIPILFFDSSDSLDKFQAIIKSIQY